MYPIAGPLNQFITRTSELFAKNGSAPSQTQLLLGAGSLATLGAAYIAAKATGLFGYMSQPATSRHLDQQSNDPIAQLKQEKPHLGNDPKMLQMLAGLRKVKESYNPKKEFSAFNETYISARKNLNQGVKIREGRKSFPSNNQEILNAINNLKPASDRA